MPSQVPGLTPSQLVWFPPGLQGLFILDSLPRATCPAGEQRKGSPSPPHTHSLVPQMLVWLRVTGPPVRWGQLRKRSKRAAIDPQMSHLLPGARVPRQ